MFGEITSNIKVIVFDDKWMHLQYKWFIPISA